MEELGLMGYLAEQLPTAVLLLVGGYFVARYAAGLMDKLLANQTQVQTQLVEVIERNTTAWSNATIALARVSESLAHLATMDAQQTQQMESIRGDLKNIRVLLATRPCVADDAVEEQN